MNKSKKISSLISIILLVLLTFTNIQPASSKSATKALEEHNSTFMLLGNDNPANSASGSPAEFVAGEVLVKFKSQVMLTRTPDKQPSTNLDSLNTLIQSQGVQSAEPVFKDVRKPRVGAMVTINGEQQAAPDLTTIYKLRLPAENDVLATVQAFRADPNIEYAEPNYLARMTDVPNDPGYGQQWSLAAVHAEEAWTITNGSPAVTIAIIDTGVDLNHPDLAGKIWTNPGEIPGNGIDDDANGYIDDVNGYDWVNLDNIPQDDNGHGTHVAGIAAADTNNGVGVAGVCWNCKIMSLKVLQSSGRGSYSDIAVAVNYAGNKGAKVINMSLGGYTDSAVLRDALAVAYPTSVLVAAAGNDGYYDKWFFPAAYGFVIGVEATDQIDQLAFFSNFDTNGPWHTTPEGYTYDIRAPGINISSTMLDDMYAYYSGTSMSAPIVAGAAGLLVAQNPMWSKEKIRAQLVNSASGVSDSVPGLLNIYAALTYAPTPFIDRTGDIVVGDETGDNDGKVDAGESVTLTTTLKNYGADEATGVIATLATTDGYVTMTNGTSNLGDISAYATNTNSGNPFSFLVNSSAPNNHDIVFQLSVTANSGSYTRDLGALVLTVQRGQEIGGVISTDTTLSADKYYIVTSNLLVSNGVTLTIQPGTRIAFECGKYIQVDGTLRAIGIASSPVIFTKNSACTWSESAEWAILFGPISTPATFDSFGNYLSGSILQYSILEYGNSLTLNSAAPYIDHNLFRYNKGTMGACEYYVLCLNNMSGYLGGPTITNNRIQFNTGGGIKIYENGQPVFKNNIIADNGGRGIFIMYSRGIYKNNVVTRNTDQSWSLPYSQAVMIAKGYGDELPIIDGNNIYANNSPYDISTNTMFDLDVTNNWWGTSDNAIIAVRVYDYYDNFNLGRINFIPFLTAPDPNAPPILYTAVTSPSGIVGAGTATYTLTFSRPMSQIVQPLVTFGVTSPYNQHQLSGSWTNSTTWVGTYSVTISTGDGINTIRVTSAQDTEGTEIPTDERFQFTIQTVGSSSLSLNATPEYSHVNLNWESSPLSNTLGYNVYRSATNATSYTDAPINDILITTPMYVDNNVTNGTLYYYKYAVVDTDLREVAFSNEVSATPNDYTTPSTPVVTDDGTCTSSTTTLHAQWSSSDPDSGIAEYKYGIGTFPGDVDVINWISIGTATQVNRTGLNLTDGITYYITVKAKNGVGTWSSAGNSDGIAVDNTCVLAPGAFNKSAPLNDATAVSTSPTLSWTASTGATSYEYCYDATNNSSCDSSWISTGANTFFSLSGLSTNTTYYWQVRAINAGGTTYANTDTWWSFTTVPDAPAAFNKSAPVNGTVNQPTSPTLTWGTSTGASSYEYCYDAVNNSTCEGTWTSTGTISSVGLSGLPTNTTYYWQVRAVNPGGATYANSTTWWSFTTVPNAPAAFNKSAPVNGAVDQPASPTLTWSASTGAVSYEYCYDTTDNDACSTWVSNGTNTSIGLSGLSTNTTYYWQVRAVNPGGTTYANGTTWWSFSTIPPAPGEFDRLTPLNGAINQSTSPTLTWEISAGATSYEYCYDTTDDNACSAWIDNGTSTSKALSGLTRGATYYWHVRAINAGDTVYANGTATAFWSFTTLPNPPVAFGKTSPTNGVINQSTSPTLTWSASTGAVSYEYCYDTTDDDVCSLWINNGTSTSKALSGLTNGTTYYWHVRAINPGGTTYANTDTWWSFTTVPDTPPTFSLFLPLVLR